MAISYESSIRVLQNTPKVLYALLENAQEDLLDANEGPNTWSPTQVLAHLVQCEETNFLQRIKFILSGQANKVLPTLDLSLPDVQTQKAKDLLIHFKESRIANLTELHSFCLEPEAFTKIAYHAKLEKYITLAEVFNTWVAHDLTHIGQISRVLAKQYKESVGPFIQFLYRIN